MVSSGSDRVELPIDCLQNEDIGKVVEPESDKLSIDYIGVIKGFLSGGVGQY